MDTAWIAAIAGSATGGLLALIGTVLQRRSDRAQRADDRTHADLVRESEHQQRVALHWLDKKQELYATFLVAVGVHEEAIRERMNPAGTGRLALENERQQFFLGPPSLATHRAAQDAFHALDIVAPETVASAAFQTIVALWQTGVKQEHLNSVRNSENTEHQTAMAAKSRAAEQDLEDAKRSLFDGNSRGPRHGRAPRALRANPMSVLREGGRPLASSSPARMPPGPGGG